MICRKYLVLLVLAVGGMLSCHQPARDTSTLKLVRLQGRVNDLERLYSRDEARLLDRLLSDMEVRQDVVVVIITVDTLLVAKDRMDSWCHQLASYNAIGDPKKHNGMLIAISKGYRRMRIENGTSTGRRLSDAATKAIIDTAFVPGFKEGHYFRATVNGLHAIAAAIDRAP